MTRWMLLPLFNAAVLTAGSLPEVFVASTGVDASGCGAPTSPCRTINYAMTSNPTGANISAVDAAEYGPLNGGSGTGPWVVDGNGVGRIHVTSNNNAFGNTTVTLRNISLDLESGVYGLSMSSGQLTMDNVKINSNGAFVAVEAFYSNLTMDHVVFDGYVTGTAIYVIEGQPKIQIRDCAFHNSGSIGSGTGIYISGGPADAMIERTAVDYFGVGIEADGLTGAATVRIGNSVISRNTQGISAIRGGQILSFQTNMFAQNGTDGVFSGTVPLK